MIDNWKQQIAEVKPELTQSQKRQVLAIIIEAYLDCMSESEAFHYAIRNN